LARALVVPRAAIECSGTSNNLQEVLILQEHTRQIAAVLHAAWVEGRRKISLFPWLIRLSLGRTIR
jgi:hypothetical protein